MDRCVPIWFVGDGKADCSDETDESDYSFSLLPDIFILFATVYAKNFSIWNNISKQCFFNTTSTGYPFTNLFNRVDFSCYNNNCSQGQYLCRSSEYCIDIEHICDGVKHCFQGDDEIDCGILQFFSFT